MTKAETVWRERLVRFQDSGLTIKAFCKAEGVSVSNFHAWKRRLGIGPPKTSSRGSAKGPDQNPPLFVPVGVASGASDVRVELSGGAVVRVPLEAGERVLACVIQAAARTGQEGSAC